MTCEPVHDFRQLVRYTRDELLAEYADTASILANYHESIANQRSLDVQSGNKAGDPERHRDEGKRDALIEKKFLIVRLLDNAS